MHSAQIWSLICIRGCASPMSVVEQDIQGICDELLTYLQAQAPIDTRIAAILNDQQAEGELLKTVTKKIENWYTQSGGGGCRGLFNARKEELLTTPATTPAL